VEPFKTKIETGNNVVNGTLISIYPVHTLRKKKKKKKKYYGYYLIVNIVIKKDFFCFINNKINKNS